MERRIRCKRASTSFVHCLKPSSVLRSNAYRTLNIRKNIGNFNSTITFAYRFFGNYALDVIARCVFATNIDSHTETTNEFVTKTRMAFGGTLTLPIILLFLYPGIFKLLRLKTPSGDMLLYLKTLCQNIIKKRKDTQTVSIHDLPLRDYKYTSTSIKGKKFRESVREGGS